MFIRPISRYSSRVLKTAPSQWVCGMIQSTSLLAAECLPLAAAVCLWIALPPGCKHTPTHAPISSRMKALRSRGALVVATGGRLGGVGKSARLSSDKRFGAVHTIEPGPSISLNARAQLEFEQG